VDDRGTLDRELAELIADVEGGDRAAAELQERLYANPATKAFTEHFLEHGVPPGVTVYQTRGFTPPPGQPRRISAAKWSCPQGDFDFFQRSPREDVPDCPTHGLPLERSV